MNKFLVVLILLLTSCSHSTSPNPPPSILGKWQGGYTQCTNCGVYTIYNLEYLSNGTLKGTEKTFDIFKPYNPTQIFLRTVTGTYTTHKDTLSENLTYYSSQDTIDTSIVVRYSCTDSILTFYDSLPHTLHRPF